MLRRPRLRPAPRRRRRRRASGRRRRAARGAAGRRGRAALAGHALRGRRRVPRPGRDDGRRTARVERWSRSSGRGRAVRDAPPCRCRRPARSGSPTAARCAAETVVVSAGALGRAAARRRFVDLPPLQVTQQQIFHFPRLDTDRSRRGRRRSTSRRPSAVYHLAGGRDGGAGDDRKIGEHDGGVDCTADTRTGVVNPQARERARRVRQALAARARPGAARRGDLPLHRDPDRGLPPRPGRVGRRLLAVLGTRGQVRAADRRAGRRPGAGLGRRSRTGSGWPSTKRDGSARSRCDSDRRMSFFAPDQPVPT